MFYYKYLWLTGLCVLPACLAVLLVQNIIHATIHSLHIIHVHNISYVHYLSGSYIRTYMFNAMYTLVLLAILVDITMFECWFISIVVMGFMERNGSVLPILFLYNKYFVLILQHLTFFKLIFLL